MKKVLIAASLALASLTAVAADFVSVNVDYFKDRVTDQNGTAQSIRAGKEMYGIQFGAQFRNQVYRDGAGVTNNMEFTAGKNYTVGAVALTPYAGFGYDTGLNGARDASYQYALAGVDGSVKAGPGAVMAGINTRLTWDDAALKRTLVYAGYSLPLSKDLSVNFNVSRSYQDIKQNTVGVGLVAKF